MSTRDTELWLAALQARFGSVLRAPLDAKTGTLRPDLARYPQAAIADVLPSARLSAAQRLSVYHKQYWMRLLNVLQEQYPLVTRLCSAWGFNQHAMRFLLTVPPRDHDLGQVAEGFDLFLADTLRDDPVQHPPGGPSVARAPLLEAARLDATFRRVFMAPEEPAFVPTVADQATLPQRRLRTSHAFARFEEHWPLLALRAEIFGSPEEHAVPVPAGLPVSQHWALHRTPRGVTHVALDDESARLLVLLEEHTLAEALARLEAQCPESERPGLPERVQRFLAFAVQAGYFSGFR